jgi:hypothetical protein
MPLGRYFAFVGSLLLALLFLIDWYMPRAVVAGATPADIDRSIIRIHSRHKWPSAVVFDTTQPTIVPPAPVVTAEAPPPKSPRTAFAMAGPPEPTPVIAAAPPAPRKKIVRRSRIARAPAPRIASFEPPGFRDPFSFGRW